MNLEEMKDVDKDIRTCDASKAIARAADRNSATITHHNYGHFLRARRNAVIIATQYDRYFPGRFWQEHLSLHVPVAAFGHDFDRSLPGHPLRAGDLLDGMLKKRGVDRRDRDIIMYAVRYHSARPARDALRYRPDIDAFLAECRAVLTTTTCADKCDSNRARVRAPWMRKLDALMNSGAYLDALIDATDDEKNWLTNYAILHSYPSIDPSDNGGDDRYRGTLVFHFELEPRLRADDHSAERFVRTALSTKWFAKGMHACENAAQNVLKLNFSIETAFAGEPQAQRWFFDKAAKLWVPAPVPVSKTA